VYQYATYAFMMSSIRSMRYLTTPSGPTCTCSPVGMACVLMPGTVSRAIRWISSCSSGVHCHQLGSGVTHHRRAEENARWRLHAEQQGLDALNC
jgi:hypothetical protein